MTGSAFWFFPLALRPMSGSSPAVATAGMDDSVGASSGPHSGAHSGRDSVSSVDAESNLARSRDGDGVPRSSVPPAFGGGYDTAPRASSIAGDVTAVGVYSHSPSRPDAVSENLAKSRECDVALLESASVISESFPFSVLTCPNPFVSRGAHVRVSSEPALYFIGK